MSIGQGKTYTLQEVADILGYNRQTLYNNIRKGYIKAAKFGKEYRMTEEQVQDILTNGFGRHRSPGAGTSTGTNVS